MRQKQKKKVTANNYPTIYGLQGGSVLQGLRMTGSVCVGFFSVISVDSLAGLILWGRVESLFKVFFSSEINKFL